MELIPHNKSSLDHPWGNICKVPTTTFKMLSSNVTILSANPRLMELDQDPKLQIVRREISTHLWAIIINPLKAIRVKFNNQLTTVPLELQNVYIITFLIILNKQIN